MFEQKSIFVHDSKSGVAFWLRYIQSWYLQILYWDVFLFSFGISIYARYPKTINLIFLKSKALLAYFFEASWKKIIQVCCCCYNFYPKLFGKFIICKHSIFYGIKCTWKPFNNRVLFSYIRWGKLYNYSFFLQNLF